jgi:hypothetical protein
MALDAYGSAKAQGQQSTGKNSRDALSAAIMPRASSDDGFVWNPVGATNVAES